MIDPNIIEIPADEFNKYPKFVRDIIVYNFNHTNLRREGYTIENLKFERVMFDTRVKKFSVKLEYVDKYGSESISYSRFVQFVNNQFNLDEIIDKCDPRDKIVYSEEFSKFKPELFKNPNVWIIRYNRNSVSVHGEESKLLSLTPGRFYLVEKTGSKYKLLTYNNFERQTESNIYVNTDSRSNEFFIKRWVFTKNGIYPVVLSSSDSNSPSLEECFVNLKTGFIAKLGDKINSKPVEFSLCATESIDTIKFKLNAWKNYDDFGAILQAHKNAKIELPGNDIIPVLPSDPRPEVELQYYDYKYSDDNEFDPDEFLLNHKVEITPIPINSSLGLDDEFLSLL